LRQEREGKGDAAKNEHRSPAYVLATNAGDKTSQHGDPGNKHEQTGDQSRRLIARPQIRVLSAPVFGHFQKFRIPTHQVALNANPVAVRAVSDSKVGKLPGEGVIGPVWPLRGLRLGKFESHHVEADGLRQKLFGQSPRLVLCQAGSRGIFIDEVREPNEITGRRNLDAILFLMQFAEPAIAPAPEAYRLPDEITGTLDATLAFKEGLGLVVELKHCRMSVIDQVQAAMLEERGAAHPGLVPGDPEVDRRFRKGIVEEVGPYEQAHQREACTDQDEADVTTFEALFHCPDSMMA
jgi:hypothetical protein